MTPWAVAHQASVLMGFSRQEYWSGLPFSTPGDLPNPGIELASPALAGRFFTPVPPGKPNNHSRDSPAGIVPETACPCGRREFDPWSRSIPQAAEQLSSCAVMRTLKVSRYPPRQLGRDLAATRSSSESESRSVVSNSLRPCGLYSPWNSPGQNPGVRSLSLLQGIFPTQGLDPGLLHCSRFFTI